MTLHAVVVASYTIVQLDISMAFSEQESRNALSLNDLWGLESKGAGRAEPTYQSVKTNGTTLGRWQLRSKVNQMNYYLSGKKNGEDCAPKRLAYQLCVWVVDTISSGSHRPRRAPCHPLSIADRVMSQSLGRGKLETKVSQP